MMVSMHPDAINVKNDHEKEERQPMAGQNQPTRRASTRNALYQAAAALFAERGYDNTTMADIAELAQTSRRTAFNHFPSKSDIPMLWTRRIADVAILEANATTTDTAEQVRAYFRLICRMVEGEPEVSKQMMLGWVSAGGPIYYESLLLDDLVPLISAGKTKGWIDTTVNVEAAARTLSDTLLGATFRWVRDTSSSVSLESLVDEGAVIVLKGMRANR